MDTPTRIFDYDVSPDEIDAYLRIAGTDPRTLARHVLCLVQERRGLVEENTELLKRLLTERTQ